MLAWHAADSSDHFSFRYPSTSVSSLSACCCNPALSSHAMLYAKPAMEDVACFNTTPRSCACAAVRADLTRPTRPRCEPFGEPGLIDRLSLTQGCLAPATAVKEVSEAYERHVRDSLALLPVLDARMAAALAARGAAAAHDCAQPSESLPSHGAASAAMSGTREESVVDVRRQASTGGRPQPQRVPPDGLRSNEPYCAASPPEAGAETPSMGAAGSRLDAWAEEDDSSSRQPQLLDVGSGAGLPGILIAIARPHWQVRRPCAHIVVRLNRACRSQMLLSDAGSLQCVPLYDPPHSLHRGGNVSGSDHVRVHTRLALAWRLSHREAYNEMQAFSGRR